MNSAFGVDHGDVSKGWAANQREKKGPKATAQFVNVEGEDAKNVTRRYGNADVDTFKVSEKGKTLFLRRPKYHATGIPSKAMNLKSMRLSAGTPKSKMQPEAAKAIWEGHKKGKKSIPMQRDDGKPGRIKLA